MTVLARAISLHNTATRVAVVLVIAALLLGFAMVTTPSASASQQQGFEAETVIPAAGAGDDDPFATSDADLAVAILLPGFFLAVTVGIIVWAWSRRETDGDRQE